MTANSGENTILMPNRFDKVKLDDNIESYKLAGPWIAFRKTNGDLMLGYAKAGANPQKIEDNIASYDLTTEVLVFRRTIDDYVWMVPLK